MKISILHIIFLTMTVIGLKNHVTIIPPILREASRDGWLSVIISAVLLIPWILIVLYIHKKTQGENLRGWMEQQIGRKATTIVVYIFSFVLMILAAFTMIETLVWATTTFLPTTPIITLLIVYTATCFFLITKDIQTIVIVNVFVLFGVVVLGFFVAFTNLQYKNYELLLPVFEHGFTPVLKGMIYPVSGFVEIFGFLFLQHYFKDSLRWYHLMIMLVILMFLTLGPLVGSIVEFGPDEAAKQRFPAYEQWGLAAIGRYIEHLDFFSIYQWLTGALIRVVVLVYIVADVLGFSKSKKKMWLLLAPFFMAICLLLLLFSEPLFIQIKGEYLLQFTFYFYVILTLFLLLLVAISRRKSKKEANQGAGKS